MLQKKIHTKKIGLHCLEEPKKKLQAYMDLIRQKSISMIELRNSLKVEAEVYDSKVAEYEELRKALSDMLEKIEKKKSAMGGVQTLLHSKMKKADSEAQYLKNEFKKRANVEGAEKMKGEFDEFVRNYVKLMRTYYRCETLLNNLPQ